MSHLASTPLRLGARALSLRTSRWIHSTRQSARIQARTLARLLASLARTRFGREHGIEPEMDYAAFRDAVPVRTYEGFCDRIERMRAGEPDELWPGHCRYFAVSSGTTAGPSKYLPVNEPMLEHFRRAGLESLLLFTARTRRTSIFGGRHLFLGGATRMQKLATEATREMFAGDLSGITAARLPWWAETFLYEPGREIAGLDDWPAKIDAIVSRTIERDIRLVAGIPSWLLVLFEKLREAAEARGIAWRDLRSIWPGLECLVHGGVPIEPYVRRLRAFVGDAVAFHEVFPASEGFLAAQDLESGDGLRLLDNVGIHFEFLPVDALDSSGMPRLGAQAHLLDACTAGSDYALVLTTPAGLCRYMIGDVVRLISADPPRILYVGRTRLQLSAFGEHVIEKELTDAIVAASHEQGLEVVEFHAAPLFADRAENRQRGRHEWWIEFRNTDLDINHARLAARIDRELQRANDDYAAKRRGGGLEAPLVHASPRGTFEKWLRAQNKWGGQNKMPRCRSDRVIADGLANQGDDSPNG